jgi:hypothetical protein
MIIPCIQSNDQADHENSDDDNSDVTEYVAPPSKHCVLESTQTDMPSTSLCTTLKVTARSSNRNSRSITNASIGSIASTSRPPSTIGMGRYISAYRPALAGPSLLQPMSALCFDAYPYQHTTCIIGEDGVISLKHGAAVETILIANDWPHHKHQECKRGGYLGKGLEIYAFQVSDMFRSGFYTDL